jgi:TrmH family RNA methyltransferase
MPDPAINSLTNPRIKELVRLRNRRTRDAESEILIDGLREISRAIAAGHRPSEVYYCNEYAKDTGAQELLATIRKSGARVIETSPTVFDKIRYGDRTGGLVAVGPRPTSTLADIDPKKAALVSVLEGLEKPGNLGAILRSADGAGVGALLIVDPVIDIYNPNAIRASIGTIFSVPMVELDAGAALSWLNQHGYAIVAASPVAEKTYTEQNLGDRTAIVLGSESKGLSPLWDRPDVSKIRIPMSGIADSLNVAATGAIIFYEAARQRTAQPGI